MKIAGQSQARRRSLPFRRSQLAVAAKRVREDQGVGVALAEYGSVRAEVIAAQQIQASVVVGGLAAAGVLSTIVLQGDVVRSTIYLLPPLMLMVSVIQHVQTIRIITAALYIRDQLWPYLTKNTSYQASWERYNDRFAEFRIRHLLFGAIFDGSIPMTFGLIGVLAMLLGPGLSPALSVACWICVILTVAVPASSQLFMRNVRTTTRSELNLLRPKGM